MVVSDALDSGSGEDNVTNQGDVGQSETLYSAEEFDQPFDLDGLEDTLRQRMVLAAPMLMGRFAVYGREFFTLVVGLCDQGPLIRDVSKVYGFIKDEEVNAVWKE